MSAENESSGNHDLCETICQITMQLDDCNTKEQTLQILEQSQALLDNNIDFLLAKELFLLILKCYSLFPSDCVPFFSQLLNKSRNNVNFTIITASVLSFLIYNDIYSQLPEYDFFINDCINEIILQIENDNQIVIFQNEMPQMFKLNFILDVVLSSKLTDQIINCLVKYLFTQKEHNFFISNKIKLTQLIRNILNAGKIDLIIEFLPRYHKLYFDLSINDLACVIPFFSKQLFKKTLPKLEEIFLYSSDINKSFVLALLQKCIEFNIKIKSIDRAFNYLSANDITSQIINYSYKYNFTLPTEVAKKFVDLQDFHFIFKIIPSLGILPKQKIEQALLEKNDLNFYKLLFAFEGFSSQILTTSKFYVHIILTLSEFKNKYENSLIQNFANYFQQNIKEEEFIKIIDEIVFSFCYSNQDTHEILFNFINSLDDSHLNLFYSKNHMKMFIMKIVRMEIVPHHSFIQLIYKEGIYNIISNHILLNQKINSRLYYIFYFSKEINPNYSRQILTEIYYNRFLHKIKLVFYSLGSNQIIQFINENNFDLLHLLDNESFSFAMNSLIFSQNEAYSITGLTEETILPFYAIVLRNLKIDIDFYPFDNSSTCLFLNTLKKKLNDNSPIVIASINSILQSTEKQISLYNFDKIKTDMIEIFMESILKDQCKEFESRLISYISSNINRLKYIKSNINDFIQYLFSKNDKYYLTIEKIIDRYQFFKESHHIINIPRKFCEQNEIPNLIPVFEYFASNGEIENDSFFIRYLFKKMMNDQNLRRCHLLLLFQAQINEHTTFSDKINDFMINDYLCYIPDIRSMLDLVYQYNKQIDGYVKRPYFEYDDIFNSEFKLGMSIINTLFNYIRRNQYCYQAFLCLKSIACSFIFLFEKDPTQIFELVLQKIDNYSIIFEKIQKDPNGEMENKAKISISAYSFLFSTLNSSKILDSFINWFFSNIDKYSDIQFFCFNNIFCYILNTKGLNHVLMASLIKHNYIDTIQRCLNKNIPKGAFREYSRENVELLFKVAKFFITYDIDIYNKYISKIKKHFKDEIEKSELDFSTIIEFINLPSLKESNEITILLDKLFIGISNNDDNKKR